MTPDKPSADSPVLIAYDGSDHAKAAIAQAGELLRTPRAAVVLSVFEPGLAIVAVLTYRLFAFWLPIGPGVIAYLLLLREEPAPSR